MAMLEVRDLHTSFFTPAGEVKAVNGISFNLDHGKVLGIVGESGSGKSVTAYSILQILTHPGRIVSGSIKFNGQELVGSGEHVMRTIRGNKISIIFQDPMTSLNPVYTIGNQLRETIRLHTDRNAEQAQARAIEMLQLVGINEPEKRLKQYPYELSGGMRQRVMIAMALACEPDILIADEPTTALDVTIQAQILELMQDLQKKMGMAIIMITHDLGVIASMCDEVIVMYAGSVCERGTADNIFYRPRHEYTKGLIRSIPNIDLDDKIRLVPIEGTPIDLLKMPPGCPFAPRCERAMKICLDGHAPEVWVGEDHLAACWMNFKEGAEKNLFEYNEDGSVNVMNAAWGTMQERDVVALNLTESHKTVKNIKAKGAFTVSIADAAHVVEADYFGVESGNKVLDKFARSGLTASKAETVDAPVINEFPLCLECEFIEYQHNEYGVGVIGKVLNVTADESVMVDGKLDMSLVNAIAFDPYTHGYYKVSERVGEAFKDGLKLKK